MLTPQEVSSRAFTRAPFNGYNMAMVDEFLDELTEDYTALYKENANLKAKMKVMVEKVEEYRETEDNMRAALLSAQRMADSIVKDAEARRSEILSGVEAEVRETTENARKELQSLEERLASGREELARFVRESRAMCEKELAFLDGLTEAPAAAPGTIAKDAIASIEEKVRGAFEAIEERKAAQEKNAAQSRNAAPAAETPSAVPASAAVELDAAAESSETPAVQPDASAEKADGSPDSAEKSTDQPADSPKESADTPQTAADTPETAPDAPETAAESPDPAPVSEEKPAGTPQDAPAGTSAAPEAAAVEKAASPVEPHREKPVAAKRERRKSSGRIQLEELKFKKSDRDEGKK